MNGKKKLKELSASKITEKIWYSNPLQNHQVGKTLLFAQLNNSNKQKYLRIKISEIEEIKIKLNLESFINSFMIITKS